MFKVIPVLRSYWFNSKTGESCFENDSDLKESNKKVDGKGRKGNDTKRLTKIKKRRSDAEERKKAGKGRERRPLCKGTGTRTVRETGTGTGTVRRTESGTGTGTGGASKSEEGTGVVETTGTQKKPRRMSKGGKELKSDGGENLKRKKRRRL